MAATATVVVVLGGAASVAEGGGAVPEPGDWSVAEGGAVPEPGGWSAAAVVTMTDMMTLRPSRMRFRLDSGWCKPRMRATNT